MIGIHSWDPLSTRVARAKGACGSSERSRALPKATQLESQSALVCLTTPRLPALNHPTLQEAASPLGALEPSGLVWGGLHTPPTRSLSSAELLARQAPAGEPGR